MRKTTREIPCWVESRRRPGRFRLSAEYLEAMLTALIVESGRLGEESRVWGEYLSGRPDEATADVTQAMQQKLRCDSRVKAIEHLVHTLPDTTYPACDVERARRSVAGILLRHLNSGGGNATKSGPSQLEG
jgi:hypothetical protein